MIAKHKAELTWGDIYYRWLRKGVDHSYAAYMADQWLKRMEKIKAEVFDSVFVKKQAE